MILCRALRRRSLSRFFEWFTFFSLIDGACGGVFLVVVSSFFNGLMVCGVEVCCYVSSCESFISCVLSCHLRRAIVKVVVLCALLCRQVLMVPDVLWYAYSVEGDLVLDSTR